MDTLQTNSSRSAWQVKSMERRKRASFCTTEIQRSWDSVKGRGSTSGVSLAVVDSVSSVERGHSAVRRRRIRSLKCWKRKQGKAWNYDTSIKYFIIKWATLVVCPTYNSRSTQFKLYLVSEDEQQSRNLQIYYRLIYSDQRTCCQQSSAFFMFFCFDLWAMACFFTFSYW